MFNLYIGLFYGSMFRSSILISRRMLSELLSAAYDRDMLSTLNVSSLRKLWSTQTRLSARRGSNPEHRTIMVIDIVGSSRWSNLAQVQAIAALNRIVRTAFSAAGIAWWRLAVAERGDGMIVLVPPGVSKVDLLNPVIPNLIVGLREHNAVVGPGLRIRLRTAIHAGEVLHARSGWVGADVNQACRLVNGEPLYRGLDRCSRADLVLVVSEVVYHGVVRHGYRGIDPASYARVRIELKETDLHAWLLVSDQPASGIRTARSSGNGLTVLSRT